MTTKAEGCCSDDTPKKERCDKIIAEGLTGIANPVDVPKIVDDKVTMLIAAGAAMAANCEPCLNKIVPDLIEAGVCTADIRRAVEIGEFVKNQPAAIMREAADALTGTRLSQASSAVESCSAGGATCG